MIRPTTRAKVLSPIILAVCGSAIWAGMGDATDVLVERLMSEEGFKSKPYDDSRGFLTIGYGFKLSNGISPKVGELLLREHLGGEYDQLVSDLPWVSSEPMDTQVALLDLGYQNGVDGLEEFKLMLAALQAGDCAEARKQALDSVWARTETPGRAKRVTDSLCEE